MIADKNQVIKTIHKYFLLHLNETFSKYVTQKHTLYCVYDINGVHIKHFGIIKNPIYVACWSVLRRPDTYFPVSLYKWTSGFGAYQCGPNGFPALQG